MWADASRQRIGFDFGLKARLLRGRAFVFPALTIPAFEEPSCDSGGLRPCSFLAFGCIDLSTVPS